MSSTSDVLVKLDHLRDRGLISRDEFDLLKSAVMGTVRGAQVGAASELSDVALPAAPKSTVPSRSRTGAAAQKKITAMTASELMEMYVQLAAGKGISTSHEIYVGILRDVPEFEERCKFESFQQQLSKAGSLLRLVGGDIEAAIKVAKDHGSSCGKAVTALRAARLQSRDR